MLTLDPQDMQQDFDSKYGQLRKAQRALKKQGMQATTKISKPDAARPETVSHTLMLSQCEGFARSASMWSCSHTQELDRVLHYIASFLLVA